MTPVSAKPPAPGNPPQKPAEGNVEQSAGQGARFRTQMPQIPGVAQSAAEKGQKKQKLIGVAVAAGIVLLVGCFAVWRMLEGSHDSVPAATQELVPSPAPEELPPPPPSSAAQHAANEIGSLAELSEPWDSKKFQYSHGLTREIVQAIAIRLPVGNGHSATSYWGIMLKAPYGQCDLEFVTDLNQISAKYGYRATHPMVVDPCSSTIYDPLKTGTLPNGSWARGDIVQGSGFRPPMQIEIRIEGDKLVAGRSED
ncbi:MAG: hypothetical protein WAM91_06460 [Candidatus Acidiferrales bacterium]